MRKSKKLKMVYKIKRMKYDQARRIYDARNPCPTLACRDGGGIGWIVIRLKK